MLAKTNTQSSTLSPILTAVRETSKRTRGRNIGFKMSAIFVALVLFLGVARSEVVQFGECINVETSCTVHEVRIEPCPSEPCALKLGKAAAISFNYTTDFTADKLKNRVSWQTAGNPSFGGMDLDACPNTVCPVESGKKQGYAYQLQIGKKLPRGTYPIEWKLWNADNESQLCCFSTTIKLKK